MSIAMNERIIAENIIKSNDLGKKQFASLSIVARYYASNGMNEHDIRESIEDILVKGNRNASVVKWSDALDRITKYAIKHPMVSISNIHITKNEMGIIDNIDGVQTKRLMFTLLCIAKYKNAVSCKNDSWVSCSDGEIMKMSNVYTSSLRLCNMYRKLRDMGLLCFSKHVDNLSVRVMFCDDDISDDDIVITDMRNLGNQFMLMHGGKYIKCMRCGLTVKANNPNKSCGRNQMYCDDCVNIIKIKQNVDSVMRSRSSKIAS